MLTAERSASTILGGWAMASSDIAADTASDAPDAGNGPTAAFVGVYFVVAFLVMLVLQLAGLGLGLLGVGFLAAHALGAAVGYRLAVAPKLPDARGALKSQAEKLAAAFALFAVLKHVLLLVFGRLGELTGGIDRALIWVVETAYINTSLLPDVAALALIGLAVNATEKARSGRI
jgi:hypothetical protein